MHAQIPAQKNHGTNLANIPCYQVVNFPNPMSIVLKTIWSKVWTEKKETETNGYTMQIFWKKKYLNNYSYISYQIIGGHHQNSVAT